MRLGSVIQRRLPNRHPGEVLVGYRRITVEGRPNLSNRGHNRSWTLIGNLSVSELDKGSWAIFELLGFTTAASGSEQSSLDALRQASATSYYKGNGSLWVKLVSSGDILGSGPASGPSGGASVSVSRDAAAVTAAAR